MPTWKYDIYISNTKNVGVIIKLNTHAEGTLQHVAIIPHYKSDPFAHYKFGTMAQYIITMVLHTCTCTNNCLSGRDNKMYIVIGEKRKTIEKDLH